MGPDSNRAIGRRRQDSPLGRKTRHRGACRLPGAGGRQRCRAPRGWAPGGHGSAKSGATPESSRSACSPPGTSPMPSTPCSPSRAACSRWGSPWPARPSPRSRSSPSSATAPAPFTSCAGSWAGAHRRTWCRWRRGTSPGRSCSSRTTTLRTRPIFTRPLPSGVSPLAPLFWSTTAIVACAALRIADIEGSALTALQFVPTVLLIVHVPLFVDVALSNPVPGANDNASGVATALRLAERHGGTLANFDLWVVFTGAQESFGLGLREFLRARRRELPRSDTATLSLDELLARATRASHAARACSSPPAPLPSSGSSARNSPRTTPTHTRTRSPCGRRATAPPRSPPATPRSR